MILEKMISLRRKKTKTVLIYQMGKVGSSSVNDSLATIDGLEVIHAHHLHAPYAAELNLEKQSMGWRLTQDPEQVSQLWTKISDGRDLYVISLVREPIIRNISAYFQNLNDIFGAENPHLTMSHEELLAGFMNRYPHSVPLVWFDKEMRQSLGINVFEYEFPLDKGWLRVKRGKLNLLLMRHDINDMEKKKQIEGLLGLSSIGMTRKNVGNDKPYARAYAEFVKEVKFSQNYLEQMLNSKYAKHFYSSRELDLLNERWG